MSEQNTTIDQLNDQPNEQPNDNEQPGEQKSFVKRTISHGFFKFFVRRLFWLVITLFAAVSLNFFLPRLMPGDPISTLIARLAAGTDAELIRRTIEHFYYQFGLYQPVYVQFFTYIGNVIQGDLGQSFSQFPRPVSDIILSSLPYTLALMIPAIFVGWILGNVLGAVAAYVRKGFDKIMLPISLFITGIPAFGMAIILLTVFAVNLSWFPAGGAYPVVMIPSWSWSFFMGLLQHYHLPFWSMVLLAIGGQAIGMRSMSIYELNADYVKYSRYMGIKDRKIVGYVFRNAMLPQVTGLALQIGTFLSGALFVEIVFSYPGLGTTLMSAVSQNDYPLLSGLTLFIIIMVLVMVFLLDIFYAIIDPRVKASLVE
ncbi:MAG: ABC transporter permease [Oscillospiraceae bacterium]|nr:ABC transporter permease [Oscillospiraceae bacterium]